MHDLLDALQWPAMATTLIASWLVASQRKSRRRWGFWVFILNNALWGVWGWHDNAYAQVVLQIGLFALNIRGSVKNDPDAASAREA